LTNAHKNIEIEASPEFLVISLLRGKFEQVNGVTVAGGKINKKCIVP
jgi:hypothetical protein